jgi:hypothetical protein
MFYGKGSSKTAKKYGKKSSKRKKNVFSIFLVFNPSAFLVFFETNQLRRGPSFFLMSAPFAICWLLVQRAGLPVRPGRNFPPCRNRPASIYTV